ncbi:tyrosine-protein phosphatase [Formosa sp. S-31]|uniref:tyrosine-protein phosphatase n=1 Tax=Formosa sp. S-31 TaxID=2790949 RepID=UPI003EC03947
MKFKLNHTFAVITAALLANGCADYQKSEKPAYTLNEAVFVERLDNHDYKLTLNTTGEWDVYSGTERNQMNWSNPQKLSSEKATLQVKNNTPQQRMFFAAVKGKDTLYLSEREINLEHAFNFRDLGGIATTDGKHTKWGMLYRSGEIAELSKADLAYLEALRLKTILDLRSDEEIADKPDKYPSQVSWKHLPIGDMGKKSKMNEMMKTIKEADPETFNADDIMELASVQFVNNTAKFKELFQALLDENNDQTPLLFHCTAGKDRTGFSSAFILKTLGVDEQTIMDEYLLSNYFRYDTNEETIEKAAKYYGLDQRILRPMMGVKANWLKRGFDEIEKTYGSFDNYLKVIGVDSTAQAALKLKYLR